MEYEVKFLLLRFKFLKILFLEDMLSSAASWRMSVSPNEQCWFIDLGGGTKTNLFL